MQNTTGQTHHNHDEIDLFELFYSIWQGKWLIIAITIITTLIAAAYAFTAEEQWTSRAQIRVAEQPQLQSYLNIQKAIHRVISLGNVTNRENAKEFRAFDTRQSLEDAFSFFTLSLLSKDDSLEAIQTTTYYQEQAALLDSDNARIKLLDKMATSNFKIEEVKGARAGSLYDLSFAANTPAAAQATLSEIVNYLNNKRVQFLFQRLENHLMDTLLVQETLSNNIKNEADQMRNNTLQELEQALAIAQQSGISNFTGNTPIGNNIIDLQNAELLFLLGETFLEAQLNTLNTASAIYPTEYYEAMRNVETLKGHLNPQAEGQLFSYATTPEFPLSKDKPRKALILVLGVLFGGVIGTFVVLLRNAIRARQQVAN